MLVTTGEMGHRELTRTVVVTTRGPDSLMIYGGGVAHGQVHWSVVKRWW